MKRTILMLFLLVNFSVFSQVKTISGQIFDSKTKKPLAFANIYINKNQGTTADFDGKFRLKTPIKTNTIHISYIGYISKSISLDKNKSFYKIYLDASNEELNEVVLTTKVENPALKIIRQVVKNKKNNDYRKRLKKFGFTKYYKFLVSVNRDIINCSVDTITGIKQGKKFTKIDSTMYKFCEEIKNKDLYLIENITKVNGKNDKIYNKVIATKTAGFKNPMYELLQIQMNDQSVYDDYYKFLMKEYLSPLTKISTKQYKYKIADTTEIQGRKVVEIAYRNTKKPLIMGSIFIDKKNYAIAKMTLNSYKEVQLNTVYNFKYIPDKDIWFPINSNTFIKKAEQKNDINIVNTIQVRFSSDSLKHTNKQTPGDVMFVRVNSKISDILLNKNNDFKNRYNLDIAQNATKQKEEVWSKYRKISTRELNTYKYMDSVFKAEKIEQKLTPYRSLFSGYYPIGFFDFNILKLLDYNQYEGFRLELGGKTNDKLFKKLSLSTYLAYGFKDKVLKYSGGLQYKLHHQTQTYLDFSYTNDLQKSSNFMSFSNQQSLFSTANHIAYYNFSGYKKFDLGFRSLLTSQFSVNLNIYKADYDNKFKTPYHKGRIEFNDYDVVGLKTKLIWEPKSKYMLTNTGRRLTKNAYPKYLLGFETNIPSLQYDKKHFIKFETQAIFRKKYINKDFTDLAVNLGVSMGDARSTQLYQPDFNNIGVSSLYKNLNISGIYRFETIKDFEFLNNILITGHLSHRINHIKLGKTYNFDIRLTTAFAYGFGFDSNTYVGIKDLRKGLFESGIEFQRLLKTMGLGVYYRYGAYANSNSIENLVFRITLAPFKF